MNINILNWFLENNTCVVDDTTRDHYLMLKNNIEGWKKGTNIRLGTKSNAKQESQKIRENLSLYLNQLSITLLLHLKLKTRIST